MSGWSGIENNQVVRVDARDNQVPHAIEQRDLLDSWHGGDKLDLALCFLQDRGTEKLCDLILDCLDVPARFKITIDLNADNSRIDLGPLTDQMAPEAIRRRALRTARCSKNACLPFRDRRRHRRRPRRLPYSLYSYSG